MVIGGINKSIMTGVQSKKFLMVALPIMKNGNIKVVPQRSRKIMINIYAIGDEK
jgi:hypothetical protein